MIPRGFTFSAVNAGIKTPEYKGFDLGLISCSTRAVLSGVFTQNLVKAAPVIIGMEQAKKGTIRAVVANAGNANACTGPQGFDDARTMMSAIAERIGIAADEVLPMSTGTIGVAMPTARILSKIPQLVSGLAGDPDIFARSIMTTDTFPKMVTKRAGEACVLGFAKGAGMIAPNMATTLAVVLTDARIYKQQLDNIIKIAVGKSFNAITIDGDMSTNDALVALSSGQVDANLSYLKTAITDVIRELALLIVKDGEGATKFVTLNVNGASNDRDARIIAMAIANSLLVKTALFGADPNWGRILAAAGYAGVALDPSEISVYVQGMGVVERGMQADSFREDTLHDALMQKDIVIEISVGRGPGRFTAWTTDLSYRYVEINAQYRT